MNDQTTNEVTTNQKESTTDDQLERIKERRERVKLKELNLKHNQGIYYTYLRHIKRKIKENISIQNSKFKNKWKQISN